MLGFMSVMGSSPVNRDPSAPLVICPELTEISDKIRLYIDSVFEENGKISAQEFNKVLSRLNEEYKDNLPVIDMPADNSANMFAMQQAADNSWKCVFCECVNRGKFCTNCGSARQD